MAKRKTMTNARIIPNEKQYVKDLLERLVAECPARRPTSDDERRAQAILQAELERLGLAAHLEGFHFNENLYANMALHFGLGTLGTIVSGVAPLAGLALHAAAGGSYYAESSRRGYFLRRLFPWKPSQNLLATLPARGEPDLRVVLIGHADAAFTGLLFNPAVVERFSQKPPRALRFLQRSMAVTCYSQFILAGIDLLRLSFGRLATLPLRPLEAVLSLPGFIAFVLNMEVVFRDQIVPGANDNLSACVALPVLAQRLATAKPDNVELVFAVSGCEEASLGGADALACAKNGVWDKSKTVVIGLDGLSNGELRYAALDGEVTGRRATRWVCEAVERAAASEPRFAEVAGFDIPVGGTDIGAFLAHGYDGVALICVDPHVGSPKYYHTMNDTPANLDYDKLMFSIDFTEQLVREIIRTRL